MGMFDYYVPDPPILCPKCGKPLQGWQGANHLNPALLVWKQGVAAPIDQRVDEECRGLPEVIRASRLPNGEIWICGGECQCGFVAVGDFRGQVENSVWIELDGSIENAQKNRELRLLRNGVRRPKPKEF
jgi:hypothetical protein